MATPVSIDQSTNLPTTSLQLERPILLRGLIYIQSQCHRLCIPTLRAQPPARTGPSCPQRHTHYTKASRVAQKKGSNASIMIVCIPPLVETILGLISRHITKKTPLSAVTGRMFTRGISTLTPHVIHKEKSFVFGAHTGMLYTFPCPHNRTAQIIFSFHLSRSSVNKKGFKRHQGTDKCKSNQIARTID
jgi:hypothetical protein